MTQNVQSPPEFSSRIRQPSKVKPIPDSQFVAYLYENAPAERVLARGAIAFPRFDKRQNKFIGALSVCMSNPESGQIKLLNVIQFDFYNFRFWSLLQKIKDKYGINAFYYDAAQKEDRTKLISLCMRERNIGRRYAFPILTEVSFSSDFYAYETLLQKISEGMFSFSAKSDFLTASILWDETKSFNDAPAEMQAVCLNIYGLERDTKYLEQYEKES